MSAPGHNQEGTTQLWIKITRPVPRRQSKNAEEISTPIAKPAGGFKLDGFKSKRAATIANVGTDPGPLTISSISRIKDFVWLHPDEDNIWSPELCFVEVPIPGAKDAQLHLIYEDIAMRYLPSAKIKRFRLALASKPYDKFFLASVPTQNLENSWNGSNLQACERSKTQWVQVSSRRSEGADCYQIDYAKDADAFPPTKWPEDATLDELIARAFGPDRMITHDGHPGLLRLLGAKQLRLTCAGPSTRSPSSTSNMKSPTATSRDRCAWSHACSTGTSTTFAPSACGGTISSARRRLRLTSDPTYSWPAIRSGRR